MKPAIEECKMVINRTVANFVKKEISANSMIIAAATVVIAAARIDGPICIKANLVRSVRVCLPSKLA